jgi:hypothetical protein
MNLKIWLINIVLAAGFVFAAANAWDSWKAQPPEFQPPGAVKKKPAGRPRADLTKPRLGDESEYELVVVQNLFSPDRKEYIPEKPPEEQIDEDESEPEIVEKPLVISGEKVVLYGVVISDDLKTAMINNPGGKLGDKKYLWIAEGQDLANLAVREIHAREVILEGDGEKYQVLLSEKKKEPKTRSTKAAGRSGDSGPTVISGGAISKTETVSGQGSDSAGASSGGKSSSGSGGSIDSGSEKDAEYETIETPFGYIKKKIR